MKTRIVLHGGNVDRHTEKNDRFFNELVTGVENGVIRVLCVYFARPAYRWDDSFDEDQYMFKRVARELGKEVETKLATSDINTFIEDVANSDIIFINGGMKGTLKEALLSIGLDNFQRMIEGKTLIGISAGANILSKYYYSSVAGSVREGIGLLNIKLLTHYSEDATEQMTSLKEFGEEMPLITAREEEYVVLWP